MNSRIKLPYSTNLYGSLWSSFWVEEKWTFFTENIFWLQFCDNSIPLSLNWIELGALIGLVELSSKLLPFIYVSTFEFTTLEVVSPNSADSISIDRFSLPEVVTLFSAGSVSIVPVSLPPDMSLLKLEEVLDFPRSDFSLARLFFDPIYVTL